MLGAHPPVSVLRVSLTGASGGLVLGVLTSVVFLDTVTWGLLGLCAGGGALLGAGWRGGFAWCYERWPQSAWTPWVERGSGAGLAALVALHIVAVTAQALPAPGGGMNRKDWKAQTVQAEMRAWTERINGWGFQWTQEEVEDALWDLATGFMEVRESVLKPAIPYYRNAGTWQSWRMFVAPHRYPSRLSISVKVDGHWSLKYQARSSEYDWMRSQLDHDRFRAALFRYGWGKKYPRQWRTFCSWVAQRAQEDFPEAEAVELKFWSYRTLTPEEVWDGVEPEGEWRRRRVLPLSKP